MKKVILLMGIILTFAFCENRDIAVENNIPIGNETPAITFSSEFGYTSYGIDVDSTEFDRAIAYDVLELTVGAEYSYDRYRTGIYYKSVVDELSTSSIVDDTGGKDSAKIDRGELILSASYVLSAYETDKQDDIFFNLIYYRSSLDSKDYFKVYNNFDTAFKYDTQGVALSLFYIKKPWNDAHQFLLSGGVLYTKADIEILAKKNNISRDTYVQDSVDAFGAKFGLAYIYEWSKNLNLKIATDWYGFDFGDVDVYSDKQGGFLEKGTLNESTYSVRVGGAYQF